jgi:AcrR family transcriptional regulator
MKHRRAMDDGEKSERRQLILQNTAALFDNAGFDRVSMHEVATQAGLAKGTLYLYFNTKEELFLALIDQAFGGWFADLQQRLKNRLSHESSPRLEAFASDLTSSLDQHPLLLRLLPILHTILEHNIPFPAALAFKQHLRTNVLQTGEQIEACFKFLQPGQGAELLLHAYAGLIGFQSMAQASPVVRQVLEQPEMSVLIVDANTGLQHLVSRLLQGYYVENVREI